MVARLVGRSLAGELVRESLQRYDEDSGAGRRAVLLFEGGRGSGKTAFLKALAAQFDGKLPEAQVDLATFQGAADALAIPRLLADLAFQLSEHCEPYGALEFPRLGLGLAIMRVKLAWTDNRQTARRQVRKVVRAHRGTEALAAVLKEVARGALSAAPVPIDSAGVVEPLVDHTVDKLSSWGPLRHPLLGPHAQWYGGEERLIGLNQWARAGDANDRLEINRLLWRAFLADVADAFGTGRHADEWPYNCAVLLDNAHADVGKAFLTQLVQLRWRGREPLALIAFGATGFTAALGDDPDRPLIHDLAEAGAEQAAPPAWTRYRLRDLTAEDLSAMLAGKGWTPAETDVVAAEVHRLTRGHPAATRLVVDAIPRGGSADSAAGTELATLLTDPRPQRALESDLLRIVLGPTPEHIVAHLAILSAARNQADGDHLLSCVELVGTNRVPLPAGLWSPDSNAEPTLLRRLLLRRLLADERKRAQAFQVLQDHNAAREDVAGSLYYTLADGAVSRARDDAAGAAVAHVAQVLAGRLGNARFAEWYALARAACWAPRPSGGTLAPENAASLLLNRIAASGPPADSVVQFVARLWIASDPLSGSARSALYWRLAGALRGLSGRFRDETGLPAAIRRYEAKADLYAAR